MITLIIEWTSQLNSLHIKKPLQDIYNTYMFASIAIYGHSDHRMDITIESASKNCSRTYITLMHLQVLPIWQNNITIEFILKNCQMQPS